MQSTKSHIDEQSMITPALVARFGRGAAEILDEVKLREKRAQLALVLELTRQRFERGDNTSETVARLAADLHDLRISAGSAVWKHLIPIAQAHPVREFLLQDPFTKWSFEKPRGYSGDAGLLDIIYQHPAASEVVGAASELGAEIFAYTVQATTSVAARERREILAREVDAAAAISDKAEVLAVACGYLRESELSQSFRDGKLGRWVALDQDEASVDVVAAANPNTAIVPMVGNVSGLMRRNYDLGTFDLVYASGLYDYLPYAVAVRLTQRLVEMLKPGGAYLFANYSDEIRTDGYMETFMDWPLILRSDEDMRGIVNAAVDRNKVETEVFYGENRNIVYSRIRRKSA